MFSCKNNYQKGFIYFQIHIFILNIENLFYLAFVNINMLQ
jgi:hypothetical protein